MGITRLNIISFVDKSGVLSTKLFTKPGHLSTKTQAVPAGKRQTLTLATALQNSLRVLHKDAQQKKLT